MSKKKKKVKKKEKQKQQISNEVFMFSMLLAVICILKTALNSYTFNIFNSSISFSIFLVPIIIYISNYITKKYGFKNSLYSIVISTLMVIAFIILIYDLSNQPIVFSNLVYNFISYFVSLFINLATYYYILTNMEEKPIIIGLNYMFAVVLNLFFTIFLLSGLVMTENMWNTFTISIIIDFIICILFVFLDKRVKRGV